MLIQAYRRHARSLAAAVTAASTAATKDRATREFHQTGSRVAPRAAPAPEVIRAGAAAHLLPGAPSGGLSPVADSRWNRPGRDQTTEPAEPGHTEPDRPSPRLNSCSGRPSVSVAARSFLSRPRRAARERGGPLPSIDVADALLDQRRELTGLPRLTRCLVNH
jgi:hypothetical protein